MSSRLNFEKLAALLKNKAYIELNENQYKELIGEELPKRKSYIKNQSPFAKWLASNGYIIAEIQEKAVIERTVCIRKNNSPKKEG